MARKDKKNKAQASAQQQQTPVRRPMQPMVGYPYPAAPASQIIQLPPIVQPIVMVPIAGKQPVAGLDDDFDDDFDF